MKRLTVQTRHSYCFSGRTQSLANTVPLFTKEVLLCPDRSE